MGEETRRKKLGYEDWNNIVKSKEASIKMIDTNRRNLEVGEIVEQLVLDRAIKERTKYPNPKPNVMAEDEKKPEDKPENPEKPTG